jgi:hypothetical protein
MTTVVYILLHLDSVSNELFSRLFIFFLLLLPVINDKFSNFQIHFSQNNVFFTYTAVALSASFQHFHLQFPLELKTAPPGERRGQNLDNSPASADCNIRLFVFGLREIVMKS